MDLPIPFSIDAFSGDRECSAMPEKSEWIDCIFSASRHRKPLCAETGATRHLSDGGVGY
jgi:hypothetical protein